MKLLHLYHDIMNLYGDYANILAVQRMLEKSGEEVVVDRLSLGDEVTFADYDFVFVGSGTEKNQKVVLADLKRFKKQIADYIKSGKVLLMTGNSFEMLGKSITDADEKVWDGLGLYDFTVTEARNERYTADVIAYADFLIRPLVGFINKSSMIYGVTSPMANVTFGIGNNEEESAEGIRDKNFFGTHIIGPFLIKNHHLLCEIAEIILGRKPCRDYLLQEKKGYSYTLRGLEDRQQKEETGKV